MDLRGDWQHRSCMLVSRIRSEYLRNLPTTDYCDQNLEQVNPDGICITSHQSVDAMLAQLKIYQLNEPC